MFYRNAVKRVYCVVFVANSETKRPSFVFDSTSIARLSRKLRNDELLKQNVQFAYVFTNVQTDFAERLAKHSKLKSVSKLDDKVIMLRRLDEKYVEFGWLDVDMMPPTMTTNDNDETVVDWNQLIDDVKINLRQVMSGEKKLKFKMTIPIFYSELQQVQHNSNLIMLK